MRSYSMNFSQILPFDPPEILPYLVMHDLPHLNDLRALPRGTESQILATAANFASFVGKPCSVVTSVGRIHRMRPDGDVVIHWGCPKELYISSVGCIGDVDDRRRNAIREFYAEWEAKVAGLRLPPYPFDPRDKYLRVTGDMNVIVKLKSIHERTYCGLRGFYEFCLSRKMDIDTVGGLSIYRGDSVYACRPLLEFLQSQGLQIERAPVDYYLIARKPRHYQPGEIPEDEDPWHRSTVVWRFASKDDGALVVGSGVYVGQPLLAAWRPSREVRRPS